ncbi:MAG: hypothetical protein ACLQPD_36865 [Desulfomonilaceae bacterium]
MSNPVICVPSQRESGTFSERAGIQSLGISAYAGMGSWVPAPINEASLPRRRWDRNNDTEAKYKIALGQIHNPLAKLVVQQRVWRPPREMNINESNEVYVRIARVINELKMDRKPVTVFKVSELTGLDPLIVFNYFYEKGLLKGK